MILQEAEKDEKNLRRRRIRYIKKLVSEALSVRKVIHVRRHTRKESVIDIDKEDVNNSLAVVEYVEDLYKFYKLAESSSRVGDYIDLQFDINEHTRMVLVNWLIDFHKKLKLSPEVLYLAVYIIDRYLAMRLVPRKDLFLVGISAMVIAGKYEEDSPPKVKEYITMAEGVDKKDQILAMEKAVLEKLDWTLAVPTTYHFLVRFIKAAVADKEMEDMSFFMAELGLMKYAMINYSPSMLAASAVYAAKYSLKMTPLWNETLKYHTGFSEFQVIECAKQLTSFHSEAAHQLWASYRKYMSCWLTL
ncbi:hypothetical protein MKW98_011868 [Papaver atlanticum]|uniref:Cyclin N-terminal domain-containing protein n=1 Tax=Papaver atlanticum TaxID=357466 RepID=A0AAD4TBG6_9MAGN|nr:hypothetical protein MKW98_025977 [Papaver atlanticum]KAI3948282.1 hypothetical protein MKW98_011868 [Papaver atlanticum]